MVRSQPALQREDPPPEDFSKPGYYKVREDERDDYFRWFDGKEWVGPEVSPIWVALYTMLVKAGADPANLRMLTWAIGSVALFLIVLFALGVLFNLFGGGDGEEPDPSASAGAVATTIGEAGAMTTTPPTTTTTTVTSTVASSTTATATQAALTIDTSGVWSFTWSWGVTVVGFEGEVTGEGNQWTFQGEYAGGGSSSWRPESGSATCNLTGEPLVDLSTPGSMNCTVTVPEDSWSGETTGQISLVLGDATKFEYWGGGTGTSSTASDSPIEVRLRPTG
jgi:hypothetical protein